MRTAIFQQSQKHPNILPGHTSPKPHKITWCGTARRQLPSATTIATTTRAEIAAIRDSAKNIVSKAKAR